MNVLHIIDSEGLYGAEIMLLNLAAEQKNSGHNPVIINMRHCDAAKHSLETEAVQKGVTFKVISLKAGLDILGALKIVKYAANHHFDIIHSHGYKPNILLGLMPNMLRKLPIISTLHGWTSTEKLSKIWLFELLDLFSLKFVNAVVVVSQAMKSHPRLQKSGLELRAVNNGIPKINFDSAQLDKDIQAFCSKGFVIGAIGRLSREKGYKYLIEALSILVKKGIDARLVIVGEGYERGLLEELIAQLGLKDKILLPGYRNNAQYYMPYFKAFVISSLTEGLPITLLEAMQAKAPIIATKVGGIPEVLQNGNAGLLVDPCNPDVLAEEITKIYNNGKFAKKIVEAAYQRVITNYSSWAMAQKYLDLYNQLINLNYNHSATDLHR